MTFAGYSERGEIAVVTVNNPPVNALSQSRGVVEDIMNGIRRAVAAPTVKAIVLTGAGRGFSAGADIGEFDKFQDSGKPGLRDLVAYMDTVEKPLVCAVHGATLGGGLETALACHYRVAAPGVLVGLPEVTLGLLPGAGGTQRLPRLIGAAAAVKMIAGGELVGSAEALATGIVDEVVTGDLLDGAIAFAGKVVDEGRPLRRTSALSVVTGGVDRRDLFAGMKRTVSKASRGNPAPVKCVECVEASATMPFGKGQAVEHRLFDELMATDESKSLRHIFFAERAAAKIPDVPEDTPVMPIRTAAVVGAGAMGSGIAMSFADAGIPVKILDVSREALDRGLATVNGHYAIAVSRGRFSQDVMDRRMALIRPTLSCSDLKDADIVVEAVFEDMPVKRQVLDTLDGTCRLGAILATSTSTLDINEIAAVTSRPEAVIGLHFFSPADAMRLLEIVRGARSSKSVVATCMKLSRTLKKVGVLVGACNGFVGNRMLDEYLREAGFLLEEGAMPQQVDRALQEYGFDMGPFSRICEMGRLGRKTGAGYYRYEAGRISPLTDPVVEDLIVDASKELGMKRREISDREIVERMVYALVNEGAKILEEAIALRSSDIDLVSVLGYGFPSYRGGPMFYAETIGYDKVCKRVKEFHESHGERWKPAPLLQRLSEGGARERKSPLPRLPR